MDSIIRAALRTASEVVGTAAAEPVVVGSSPRSVVMRCLLGDGAGSVFVKVFSKTPEGRSSFTSEAAGLSWGLGGPALLGADTEGLVVVMEDVGPAPSLAEVLVGADASVAARGLREWARELGRMAAASVGRRDEFDKLRKRYRTDGVWSGDEPWIERNGPEFLAALEADGIAVPAGLATELRRIATAGEHAYAAFTPGDPCPYNALVAPGGVRLIDFELSGYLPVFLIAAYCRSPFPSCWCVYRMPDEVLAEVERAFRTEIVGALPQLADDAVWEAGMRWATAVWTVDATAYWLRRVTAGDGPMQPERSTGPTRRQVLRYRWERAEELLVDGDYPAVRDAAGALLRQVGKRWEIPALPVYPAFA
ncbi:hypothetical protein [Streptomyces noursei]|uniref:hypothetical protein n=1 Tax=Streptomyces noursei TaxID=1971 RepID=UPI00380F4679